jgi:hypothetical protein
VWRRYDNGVMATQRNLPGMKDGVTKSECLLLFLSGRREAVKGGESVPDAAGEYEVRALFNGSCLKYPMTENRLRSDARFGWFLFLKYQGLFTRWFCHEEMATAHEQKLRCVGVRETELRHGKPDFALEKSRALFGGKDGGPVNENAPANVRLLDDVCFLPFRREQHEIGAMLAEIIRQAKTAATVLEQGEEEFFDVNGVE